MPRKASADTSNGEHLDGTGDGGGEEVGGLRHVDADQILIQADHQQGDVHRAISGVPIFPGGC